VNSSDTFEYSRRTSVSDGVPFAIWYLVAVVVATIYAVFFTEGGWLWTFSILYWVGVGVFLYCYSRVQPFDLLSPVIGLIILLFLYSFASGLFVEEFGIMYFGEVASEQVLRIYYICCLTGLAGLCMGALLGSHANQSVQKQREARSRARHTPADPVFQRKLLFWSFSLALALSGSVLPQFDFLHVASYSERALALRLERSGVANAGLKEVFLTQLPVSLILCGATLLTLKGRRWATRLFGSAVLTAYLVANTLAGWRGAVVAALLIPVVYYHYRIKRVSTRLAIIGGLSIYLFVNGLSVVRSTSNPLEMVDVLRENVSANGLAFAGLATSGELAVGQNLMRLISGIESGETRFTYGASIISDILVFVPRSLYPGRPLPLSEKFVQVFYPGVLESGGGYGFFILQDGYWAFGVAGVFIFMLAYGWAVQKIYLAFMKHLTSDLAVFAYTAVYSALVLAAVRTGTIGSFKGAVINAIPFIVLWLLLHLSVPDRILRGKRARSVGLQESAQT
jgi:oligosaccharide repeat unit polymerase